MIWPSSSSSLLYVVFIGHGPIVNKPSRASSLRRKLGEWNAEWMGLGLSLAIALLIANGTKNLIGKPKPDLLARCNPRFLP